MEVPPFYPDRARPYFSETEAKTLFDQVETIFKNNGTPAFPLILLPIIFTPVPVLAFMLDLQKKVEMIIGAGVLFVVCGVCIYGTLFTLANRRQGQVTQLIEDWSRTEGGPRGLFLELGDKNGASADGFWRTVFPNPKRMPSSEYVIIFFLEFKFVTFLVHLFIST